VSVMGRVRIRVSPGARERAARAARRRWKARVTAPPERGRANAALEELLARALDVPRGAVRAVAGTGSRSKVVEEAGLDTGEVERRLDAASG
jgi:uncharacterized protein